MEQDRVLKTVRRLTILAATFLIASLLISGYSIYFYTTLVAPLKDSVEPETVSLDDQQAMGCNVTDATLQEEEVLTWDDTKDYGKLRMSAAYPFPELEAATDSNSPIEVVRDNDYTMCECDDCFDTGFYVGNGIDDRLIPVDFQPDAVIIFPSFGGNTHRTSEMSGDYSCHDSGCQSNMIQAFEATGFQVGTDTHVNGSSLWTYYWVAWTE